MPENTASKNSIAQSAFVALASMNLKAQTEFYQSLLGIAPHPSTPAYTEFQLPGLRLAIFRPKEDNAIEFGISSDGLGNRAGSKVSSGSSSGTMSLCIEVADLSSAIAHLQTLGCGPLGEIMQTSHGDEIYAYDPDGNRLILHQAR